MKHQLKQLHRQLVTAGYFISARLILRLMCSGSVFISDASEAWDSGAASFLMRSAAYSNRKHGMIVHAK